MNASDKIRFAQIMAGMADNFRDSVTKEGMAMRFEMLSDYSIHQIETAAKKILQTRKYTKMPPVAEFIEAINGKSIPVEMIAEEQWGEVIRQMREVGSWGEPVFKDKTTERLLTIRFHYKDLCAMTTHELSFVRKEFISAYVAKSNCDEKEKIDYHPDTKLRQIAGGLFGEA